MDYRTTERLARQFAIARNRGDRAAALILRGRIHAEYVKGKARGFWNEFASEWFDV